MNYHLRPLLLVAFLIVLAVCPRVSLADDGQSSQSLNGEWRFTTVFDPGESDWSSITVRADNSYQRGAWWPWEGISRSVNLIGSNDLRLEWLHFRSEPDLKTGSAKLWIRYRVVNASDRDTEFQIASRLDSPAIEIVNLSGTVAAGEAAEVEATAKLTKDQVRLWHFDRPILYELRSTLNVNANLQHRKTDRFGIRKVAVTRTAILLNGEPMRLVGFNRVSDGMGFGNTEPDELVNLDVDLMKECGAVFSRIMHYPQAPNFLDRLDEKGMMVFCEIPVWQHDPQIITDNPVTKQWLKEMIHRDYNHPSIIGWSVGSEMRDYRPYAISMMDYVREELDPHRLVNFVADRTIKTTTDEPIEEGDIAMINAYDRWGGWMNLAAERFPSKPIFMSEFGLKQMEPDGRFREDFVDEWKKLTPCNPRIVGASLWTFNDYRSSFRGTQPTGFRTWGVVDQDRKRNPLYYTLRNLFSPLSELSVDDGRVTVRIRGKKTIPSHGLRGYNIRWTVESAEGTELQSGELDLPDLKPGNAARTAVIPSDASANGDENTIVSLVSPLGYVVDDTRQIS